MNTCPPCNHDCNEGRDCPARKGYEMTAIGFLMVVIGFVGGNISHNSSNVPGWIENIFAAMFLLGLVMIIVVLMVLMWRYLP